jgi:Ca-activated chloride channel family protein
MLAAWVFLAAVPLGLMTPEATGQQGSTESLLLILDASGSMNGDDGHGRPKIDAAKDALRSLVDSLPVGAPVGLRVYGHRVPNTDKANGCRDSELVAPVRPLDPAAMKAVIGSFHAVGFTPIGFSLQESVKDLPAEGERTVVLVSDGADTCAPPEPCDVAKTLRGQGVDLKIETVGFQVDPAARGQLQCIAAAGGGSYRDAGDAASLSREVQAISARALRQYTAGGTPVQGGSAFRDAPLLEAGLYKDGVLAGETNWYAVNVAAGQQLTVTATLVGSPDTPRSPSRLFQVIFVNPALERFSSGDGSKFVVGDLGTTTRTIKVSTGAVAGPGSADRAKEAGKYYFTVQLKDGDLARREFPLELEVALMGAGTTTSSGIAPSGTQAGRALPAASSADDGGLSPWLTGVGGLVLGAVAGAGAVVLAKRRSAA